jgi:hypothetical protein
MYLCLFIGPVMAFIAFGVAWRRYNHIMAAFRTPGFHMSMYLTMPVILLVFAIAFTLFYVFAAADEPLDAATQRTYLTIGFSVALITTIVAFWMFMILEPVTPASEKAPKPEEDASAQ